MGFLIGLDLGISSTNGDILLSNALDENSSIVEQVQLIILCVYFMNVEEKKPKAKLCNFYIKRNEHLGNLRPFLQ